MPFALPSQTLDAYRMPDLVGAVEFVGANRVLSSRYSRQTTYSLDFTPYHREPLACIEDERTEFVTLLMASQTGKTTLLENAAFFLFAQAPAPMIWALPGLKSRDDFLAERLKPTINACPKFKEMLSPGHRAITQEGISFRAAPLFLALADSESDLASRSCKYVIADEIDKFPRQTTNEGSPLSQLRKRQRTFRGYGAKFLQSSTPTDPQGAIWQQYLASDRREWHVPCPKCGKFHQWETKQIKWTPVPEGVTKAAWAKEMLREGSAVRVWWECPSCGAEVEGHRAQNDMNSAGKFVAQAPFHGHAGFRVPAMASKLPVCSWRNLASEFLAALHDKDRGDDRAYQIYTNHEEALPYAPKKREMGEASVMARVNAEADRGVVQPWSRIVTLGIDTQSDRFYWVATGWDMNTRGSVIDHGEVGDWDEIQGVIARAWEQEGTRKVFSANMTLMDSGGTGLKTGDVYRFCSMMDRGAGKVMPVKGASINLGKYYNRSMRDSQKDKKGAIVKREPLIIADTIMVKDFLANCLDRAPGLPNAFSFHSEVKEDEQFQRQIVSEERGPDPKTKKTVWKTREGYEANHYWDALVYATVGALMLGILSNRPVPRARRRRVAAPAGRSADPFGRTF